MRHTIKYAAMKPNSTIVASYVNSAIQISASDPKSGNHAIL